MALWNKRHLTKGESPAYDVIFGNLPCRKEKPVGLYMDKNPCIPDTSLTEVFPAQVVVNPVRCYEFNGFMNMQITL